MDVQQRVQAVLDELTERGEERGLQAAAYLDGDLIVDAWSGVADPASGRPVDGETLFTVFSVGKGVAATALHIVAARGLVDYDAPVCRYWSEFAVNGKDAITVRQVLTHSAGIPQLPEGASLDDLCDWERIASAVAVLTPIWEPGSKTGYHATTYGFLVGELVRRVDGRAFARFVQEEICAPLGIDSLFYGVPEEAEGRVATLEAVSPPNRAPAAPESLAARVMGPVPRTPAVWNLSQVRRACIPAAGMITNARAVARHYAALIGAADGVRLLPEERVRLATEQQSEVRDLVTGMTRARGLGYVLAEYGGPTAFGHGGTGGAVGFADPEQRLAFALTKNRLVMAPTGETTAARVARTVREALSTVTA